MIEREEREGERDGNRWIESEVGWLVLLVS